MQESIGGKSVVALVVSVLAIIVGNAIWQFLRDEDVSVQVILISIPIALCSVAFFLCISRWGTSVRTGFKSRDYFNRMHSEFLRKYLPEFREAQGQIRVLTEGIRGNQAGSVTLNILDKLNVPYPSKSDFSESPDDMRVWNPLSSDSPESQNYVRAWRDFITQLPPLAQKGDIKAVRRLWPDMRDPPGRLKRIWRRVGG